KNFPGAEVYGTIRWRSRTENIEHIRDRVRLIECDLKDPASVQSMIGQVQPERLFHLAAESFVPTSWKAPSHTVTVNCLGQINVMEALRESSPQTRMQIACSSEEYGMVYPNEIPIREDNPLRPLSPYAVSKVTQDFLGYQYYMSYQLHVVRTRAFNHTGPRRGEVFVESNFARQIAMIELGLQEPEIRVGNLQARRDFTDVRDIVRGYWVGLEKAEPGEVYNLCSGKSITIQRVLEKLLALSTVKATVVQDPARMRP
ncbi:MAG: GDP-mannose 4,6-dehydratase, partial [Candidatus Xenobia bacterium]